MRYVSLTYLFIILPWSTQCDALLKQCASPEEWSENTNHSPKCEIHLRNTNSLIECFGQEQISVSRPQRTNQDRAKISCEAPYPIDIDMIGLKSNSIPSTFFERVTDDVLNETSYKFKISVPIRDLSLPRWFIFKGVTDSSLQTKFYLYRPSKWDTDSPLGPRRNSIVRVQLSSRIITIPCLVDHPSTNIILVKKEENANTTMDSVEYNPTEGFLLDTALIPTPLGEYFCIAKNSATTGMVRAFLEKSPDFLAMPPSRYLDLYLDTGLTLSCMSSTPISISGEFNYDPLPRSSITSEENDENLLKYVVTYRRVEVKLEDTAVINCKGMDNDYVYHTWSLNEESDNEVTLVNNYTHISCQSKMPNLVLLNGQCWTPSNCRIRQERISRVDISDCGDFRCAESCSIGQKCFAANELLNNRGLVKCSSGIVSRVVWYIIGLDGLIYTDWEKAPITALIRISSPKELLYTRGQFVFKCKTTTFPSDYSPKWVFKTKEGTLIQPRNIGRNFFNHDAATLESEILLESTTWVEIICMVPIWNSRNWIRASQRLDILESRAPRLTSTQLSHTFVIGDTHKTLTCAAYGFPLPKSRWIMTGRNDLELQENADGSAVLTFPVVDRSNAGDYICEVSNIIGNSRHVFYVDVEDAIPPNISKVNELSTFTTGDTWRNLICEAKGIPKPTLTWYRNDSEIKFPFQTLEDGKVLQFPRIDEYMEGDYYCLAINRAGNFTRKFQVEISCNTVCLCVYEGGIPVAVMVVVPVLVVFALVVFLGILSWRLKRAQKEIRNLTQEEVDGFLKGNPESAKLLEQESDELVLSMPYNAKYEIPRHNIDIDEKLILGSGAFGVVYKGKLVGSPNPVAIKTVLPDSEITYFKSLLSEVKIMIHIGRHPHVVTMIGASTDLIKERKLLIVVEYSLHGCLEGFLRKNKRNFCNQIVDGILCNGNAYKNIFPTVDDNIENPEIRFISTSNLIDWCYHIADGMDYLTSRKVVHADLAARNVLVFDNLVAKITDFGLSRQLYAYTSYIKKQQEPLPWRSMALETLRELKFTDKSDVWALGVTIWEIFSLGCVPYPGRSWSVDFVDELGKGLRMTMPEFANNAIYEVMISCWHNDPDQRPTFSYLREFFGNMKYTPE